MAENNEYNLFEGETEADIAQYIFDVTMEDPFAYEKLLRQIEHMINRYLFERAEILLDLIAEESEFIEYHDMVAYLNGVLNEKRTLHNLGKTKRLQFESNRKKAKSFYAKRRNDRALELYQALENEYKLDICEYYIGKIYFREGAYDEAKEAFLKYLEKGGSKSDKVYDFLGKIEKANGNIEEAHKYFKKANRIAVIFGKPMYWAEGKNKQKSFEESYLDGVGKLEFQQENSDSVDEQNYYDSDLKGKLLYIKKLLQTGNINTGLNLLKELEKECEPQERKTITDFRKRVLLYTNQGKRNGSC